MFNKYAGDTIAQEMLKFIKKAQADYSHDKMSGDARMPAHHDDDVSDMHSDESWDSGADQAEDFMMDDSAYSDSSDDSLMSAMDSMHDHAMDNDVMDNDVMDDDVMDDDAMDDVISDPDSPNASAKDVHLMKGLGKIEASLRRKGEGFAADLVRATAYEIKEDIIKEAAKKEQVLKELVKMASNLIDRGEYRAAEMVRMTVNKINR